MYTEYFGLTEEPFTIAANPRFLFMSAHHREALAHLMYGLGGDCGFVLLTGEVGTGKTTVCRCLLEQLPSTTDVAFILNPKLTVPELLGSMCDELHIDYPPGNQSVKVFVDAINRHLLAMNAAGRSTVLLIDEAQNLDADVLEQLRLLTNLETNERKLLRIVLIGQPELDKLLARPELRQLNQRITARYHLRPLLRTEIGGYVTHRLAVAGARKQVFSPGVLGKLHRRTGGVPRLINMICDRAMLGAYTQARQTVNSSIMGKAVREVKPSARSRARPGWTWALVSSGVLAIGAAVAAALYYGAPGSTNGQRVALDPPVIAAPPVSEPVTSPAEATESPVTVSGAAVEPDEQQAREVSAFVPEPSPFADPVDDARAPTLDDQAVASLGTPVQDPAAMQPIAEPMREPSAWPRDNAILGTPRSAFDTLFAQWGIDYGDQDAEACAHAERQGLRCYVGVGNLGSLSSLDRPAVLTLRDPQGREYFAVLAGLTDGVATLVLGDKQVRVTISDLESRWLGKYVLLWRPPPLGYGSVRPGASGEHVAWLAGRLALLPDGDTGLRGQRTFDDQLETVVKDFQRSRGLVADGIAGRRTVIQLNTLIDPSVPRILPAADPIGATG